MPIYDHIFNTGALPHPAGAGLDLSWRRALVDLELP
jgi:hypothetical protein